LAEVTPDYNSLKKRKDASGFRRFPVVPGLEQAGGLEKGVQQELSTLTGERECRAGKPIKKAMKAHTAGMHTWKLEKHSARGEGC